MKSTGEELSPPGVWGSHGIQEGIGPLLSTETLKKEISRTPGGPVPRSMGSLVVLSRGHSRGCEGDKGGVRRGK